MSFLAHAQALQHLHTSKERPGIPPVASMDTTMTTRTSLRAAAPVFLALCAAMHAQPLGAQTAGALYPSQEYADHVAKTEAITAHGADVFGDSVNLFNGTLSFRQTDLSVPGNNTLPVGVSRRFTVSNSLLPVEWSERNQDIHTRYQGLFGEWDIDLPYIGGTFRTQDGWNVSTSAPLMRCSSPTNGVEASPKSYYDTNTGAVWIAGQFSERPRLNAGGSGGELRLASEVSGFQMPGNVANVRWIDASSGWRFACTASLASGQGGDGFVGIAPDGTRYHFNWMVQRTLVDVKRDVMTTPLTQVTFMATSRVNRSELRLYPTRVEDRFGNAVTYTWSGSRLTGVSSSDGRTLSLAYNAQGRIASITGHGTTVSYAYNTNGSLTRVTYPDASTWQFNFGALATHERYVGMQLGETHPGNYESGPYECSSGRRINRGVVSLSATSPSGASGIFEVANERLYRSGVPFESCSRGLPSNWIDRVMADGRNGAVDLDSPYLQPHMWTSKEPVVSELMVLKSKRIFGPALTAGAWTYQYTDVVDSGAGTFQARGHRQVVVNHPDGRMEEHIFGAHYRADEAQLLTHRILSSTGDELRRIDNAYLQFGELTSGPFSVGFQGGFLEPGELPAKARTIHQDQAQFHWAATDIDLEFFQVRQETESSSLGYSRTARTEFFNDTARWVIGQPRRRINVDTGVVEGETIFDPATGLPVEARQFGLTAQTLSYNADGTVAWVRDGGGNQTTFSSWYRGIPRTIQFADGANVSAVVDPLGRITSVTNELGYTTQYGYDSMGRRSSTTFPTGDVQSWLPVNSSFQRIATVEFGIPAGHWRQSITRGAYRKDIYFDALWRPILEREQDTSNAAATTRFTAKRFDLDGRELFTSYPVGSASSWAAITLGSRQQFDALGRPVRSEQDSEHGVLATTIAYLPGFLRQTTNPRGFQTVEYFWAHGEPSYDNVAQVNEPEQRATVIERDIFGRTVRIQRGDLGRHWVYDAHGRLCKAVEPETGATFSAFDAAGNLAWSARGSSRTSLTCDRDDVPAFERIERSYDARNRLLSVDYPDSTPDETYTYFADGKLATGTRANVDRTEGIWSYQYNRRGLITREHINRPGIGQYAFRWEHDPHGHVSTYRDPWTEAMPSFGLTLDFAPNALGQPTRAGSFATNATYFPNGALKSFTYGNGAVYTAALNQRGMLDRAQVARSGAMIVDDSYDYDAVGNVVALTDTVTPNGTRSMTYDGINRLLTASYGNGTEEAFTYDYLDNIRTWRENTQTRTFNYDGRNQLSSVSVPGPLTQTTYAYNAAGEQISRTPVYPTSGPTQVRTFDMAGRLARVTGLTGMQHSGGEVRYEYDVHGRRVTQWRDRAQHTFASPDVRVSYYTFDGVLRGEADNFSGKYGSTDYVYLGSTLVAKSFISWTNTTPRATTYMHTDMLGSTIAETDQTGTVVRRERHLSYGAPMDGVIDDTIGYTGHQQDPATGLIQMQQRFYDPEIGLFLSSDPVTAYGGLIGQFHRSRYANSNPYSFTDPDGRQSHARCGGSPANARICAEIAEEIGTSGASGAAEAGSAVTLRGAAAQAPTIIEFFENLIQTNESAEPSAEAPPLPEDLVGENPRLNKSGTRATSGTLTSDNGGVGDYDADLEKLAGGVREVQPGENVSAPPEAMLGENGVFGREVNSSGGRSIDIPPNGSKPHETLHYPPRR